MLDHKYRLIVKVGTRLALGFGLTLVYTIILVAFALSEERALHDTLRHYDSDLVPSLRLIHSVVEGVATTRRYETQHLVASSSAELSELESKLMQDRSRVLLSLQSYRSQASDAQDRADCEKLLAQTQDYFRVQDQVLALSRSGANADQHDAAAKLLLGDSLQAFYALNDTAQAWAKHNEALSDETVRNGEAVYQHGLRTLITLTCLALLSSVLAAVRITGGVTRPLGQAVELANSVAGGDLTRRLEVHGSDELCALFRSLNEMSSQLSTLITDMKSSAAAVAATAGEIARSNQELGQRTQQQAASLEETAASMVEITTLGKNNSDNASNADKLAHRAWELAETGGSVVGQAVGAMGAINQGSTKISNIISVIDDIAFQTNLLALNAAVEAARAGEQGRGFAVVASEVRGLAQRSADAAKQIKGLIIDSADKVRAGTELVDRSGQALSQILESVREMTHLIKQIANSSQEQAEGVQRINESILHLDGATQQNATLVEEGSAASSTLKDQADALSRRASLFTVAQALEPASEPERHTLEQHPHAPPSASSSRKRMPAVRARPASALKGG